MTNVKDIKTFITKPFKRAHKEPPEQKPTKLERVRAWFRRWRWYVVGSLALLLVMFGVAGASADAPGDFGYPIKRGYERISLFFTFGRDAKEDKAASRAGERVREAVNVTHQIPDQTPEQQIVSAQTIQDLLEEYMKGYITNTTTLSQNINNDSNFSDEELDDDLQRNARVYAQLMELRLEVPPSAQATVLQAMNVMQNNIATLQDALNRAPVTPDDSNELGKLVSQGFLTREELTQLLAAATSNRQFLDSLRNLVRAGQLPSGIVYAINFDLIKEHNSKQAARFAASVAFDEMSKVAIFAETVTPTPEQKQTVRNFLASYNPGDQLPRDVSTRAFVMPLVYGLTLTPELPTVLQNLDADELSPVRRSLYDAWKPLIATQAAGDAKQLYSQALQLAGAATTHSAVLMERVQLEVLNAVRANVAFLALPPGWTAAQVAAVQDDFAKQIADLKSLDIVTGKGKTALNAVADMTAPLVTPADEPKVEAVREAVQKQVVQLQQELVTVTTTVTDPSALVPDIEKKVAAVQEQFDAQVKGLGETTGITADEVAALREAVKESLASALEAHSKLQDYLNVATETQTAFASSIAAVAADHNQTATTLAQRIAQLDAAAQASLSGSVQDIKTIIADNFSNLQTQLAGSRADGAAAQIQAQLSFIAHSDQIALLEHKLNLSDAARAALKAETEQAVGQLQAQQSALINGLQTKIDSQSALHSQLNDEARQLITDIKNEQAQLLTALQDQANNSEVLQGQLEASIAALQTVQDQTEGKLQGLAAGGESLTQQLQTLKADLDTASQTIQSNVAATGEARTELQLAINELKDAQTFTQTQLDDGFEAMATQLRQAVNQLSNAQSQMQLELAGLTGGVDSVKSSVASILATEATVQLRLNAQAQANLDIRNELSASITQLQQAQTATQSQLDDLKTDVGSLKASVTAIGAAQTAAEVQINQLLTEAIQWQNLPATLEFSQDQFRQYEQQLADEFTAKSAALQRQFDAYKAELNGTIQQLRTDTNAALQQLKAEQAALKAQLEQTQSQLQLLQTAPATTTPTTPSL